MAAPALSPAARLEGPAEPGALPDVDEPDPLPELESDQELGAPEDQVGEDQAKPDQAKDRPLPPAPSVHGGGAVVRVAVGLSGELDGTREQRAILDRLEHAALASPDPATEVRRLRVGAATPIQVCREGRDDLVINIAYLPDHDGPVLLTRDCLLDRELGVRARSAAEDAGLIGVLWAEHVDALANGARERRRLRVSPKVRTGLIAGAAAVVVGVALGLLIASAVQKQQVVVVVSPN